jgi:FAD/FMN-containing dehydrogenase
MSSAYDPKLDATREPDATDADRAALLDELDTLLPAEALLRGEEALRPFECDGLSVYRQLPLCVALPATPREAITEAVAEYGLYYAPDPSSQIACTIGGNVAENSGGVHCLKYGLTVHNILRLKLVTIDGELFEVGSEALDAAGARPAGADDGSEGMLGGDRRGHGQAAAPAGAAQALLAAFDDVETAGAAVARDHRRRHRAGGAGDDGQPGHPRRRGLRARRLPGDAAAILICELDGFNAEVSMDIDARARAAARPPAPPTCAPRATTPSGWCSGRAARPPSRPSGASRRTTTAWTAPSRAQLPRC